MLYLISLSQNTAHMYLRIVQSYRVHCVPLPVVSQNLCVGPLSRIINWAIENVTMTLSTFLCGGGGGGRGQLLIPLHDETKGREDECEFAGDPDGVGRLTFPSAADGFVFEGRFCRGVKQGTQLDPQN